MSDTELVLTPAPSITFPTPRVRRGAAAVIAQYIQDLSHSPNAR